MMYIQMLCIKSMSAQSMLNLVLSRKGFKMGHLNIQGIKNKINQIDLLLSSYLLILDSSQNNIKINWLSELSYELYI